MRLTKSIALYSLFSYKIYRYFNATLTSLSRHVHCKTYTVILVGCVYNLQGHMFWWGQCIIEILINFLRKKWMKCYYDKAIFFVSLILLFIIRLGWPPNISKAVSEDLVRHFHEIAKLKNYLVWDQMTYA